MKSLKGFRNIVKKIFELLSKNQKKKMMIVTLFILISGFLETLGVSAILPFIQTLTAPGQLQDKWYVNLFSSLFGPMTVEQIALMTGGVIIFVYVVKNLVLVLSAYVKSKFSAGVMKELAVLIMDSYMHRPYEYFSAHNSSEIVRGVGYDVNSIYAVINNLMQLFTEAIVAVMIGIFLIFEDPVMAAGVVVAGLLIAFILVFLLKKKISSAGAINKKANQEVNKTALEMANGVKDIFVMQKQKVFMDKFVQAEEDLRRTSSTSRFVSAIPERLIETFCICGIIIVVMIRFAMGVDMSSFISSLAVFAVAAFRMLPSISRISSYTTGILFYKPGLDIAHANILESKAYIASLENAKKYESSEPEHPIFVDALNVNDLTWRYPDGDVDVLSGLSLHVKRGESVGLIGESGAGKSTFSDILLGLYRPQMGTVCVDGKSIFDIPQTWSKLMCYVPQDVFLADDTIRANVAFGDSEVDDEKIWKALDQSSLKEFVESLPKQLDTIVGERGIKFSGGQKQRIAIARALYRNPQILILDEATSALDNDTEKAVMEAVDKLQGSITLIIIAHRLTTIKNCDSIYEISHGKAIKQKKENILI